MRERFANKESCATARGRDDVRAITGSADQRVVWRGTVQKFSSGGSGFDPSFSEAEKVRIVGVDQIRQCSRMKRLENGANVESAHSDVCWASEAPVE